MGPYGYNAGYSYGSIQIARLFVRTRMVIVTGYSYRSVYTMGYRYLMSKPNPNPSPNISRREADC